MTTDDVRNACDVMQPVYDATDGVDGRVSIEVDPRLAHDTEQHHRPGQAAARRRRPRATCSSRSRRTLDGLPAITAAIADGHQRQRHPDLQPRALPGRDERLPQRPRAGARSAGTDLVEDRVRRVVLRVACRHRDRQAARRHRHRRGQGPQGQGRRRERPAGVPGLRGGLLDPALEVARGRGGPARSARCGRRRESRTPPTRTRCTSSTSSPPASSTPCRRRRSTRSPTTARSSATRSPAATRRPRRSSTTSSAIGVSYNDVVQVLEDEGVDKFEKAWGELLDDVPPRTWRRCPQKAAQW